MTSASTKPTKSFWTIAILATIWFAFGAFAYLGQAYMTDEMLAMLPEEQQQFYTFYPAWATAAFAIATWSGLAACVLLLLRKKVCYYLFVLSFFGVIVQNIYGFLVADGLTIFGPSAVILPIIVILVDLLMINYSKKKMLAGILN